MQNAGIPCVRGARLSSVNAGVVPVARPPVLLLFPQSARHELYIIRLPRLPTVSVCARPIEHIMPYDLGRTAACFVVGLSVIYTNSGAMFSTMRQTWDSCRVRHPHVTVRP